MMLGNGRDGAHKEQGYGFVVRDSAGRCLGYADDAASVEQLVKKAGGVPYEMVKIKALTDSAWTRVELLAWPAIAPPPAQVELLQRLYEEDRELHGSPPRAYSWWPMRPSTARAELETQRLVQSVDGRTRLTHAGWSVVRRIELSR